MLRGLGGALLLMNMSLGKEVSRHWHEMRANRTLVGCFNIGDHLY